MFSVAVAEKKKEKNSTLLMSGEGEKK